MLIYDNPNTLAAVATERLLLTIIDLLAEPTRTRVDIALTGGTDGNAILHAIGTSPLRGAVDWKRVHCWWGDERFVAADDPDRNAKQAYELCLGALVADGLLPESNIHPMPADTRAADTIAAANDEEQDAVLAYAAEQYQRELIDQLGTQPRMDIAMFGMGPDAHFASLFPGLPQVCIDDPHVLVAGVRDSPKPPPLRLTLTVPMISRSERTWIITSREGKAKALRLACDAPRNPQAPVSYADAAGEVLWMVDQAAASLLS